MQVQLYLVDQHDCFCGKRIGQMRVAVGHAPRQVSGDGKNDSMTAAQLIE